MSWHYKDSYMNKKDWFDFTNTLSVIEKEKPDVWLCDGQVFRDFNWERNNNTNYLFLKDDKIYVYRSRYKRMYELNNFVHKFFKEKQFKKRAILDEQLRNKGVVLCGAED